MEPNNGRSGSIFRGWSSKQSWLLLQFLEKICLEFGSTPAPAWLLLHSGSTLLLHWLNFCSFSTKILFLGFAPLWCTHFLLSCRMLHFWLHFSYSSGSTPARLSTLHYKYPNDNKVFFVVLLPPPFPKLYTHRLGRLRTRCAISGLLYSKKFPQIEQPKCGSKIKNWGWLNCIYYHLPEHGAKIGPDEVSRPYGTSST